MISSKQDEARAAAHALLGLHGGLLLRRFLHVASLDLDRALVLVGLFVAVSAAIPVSLLDHR